MKKVISLFTAIVMLFASVVTTIPAAASSDLSSQEYELQVKAENSLGSLLADALLDESESDENKDGFTGYCIGGAEVSGNTVTIDYCAIEDCTIIAALYDDSGENMLMSGNAEVSASERQTTVTISGTMPDYFLLKVYPVDETTLRPLGPEYVNSDHTKAFQEAWAKTTNDFPEELVLNIDDNSDTNFFVHNEEVERVDYVEGVNIVASADFDNNVYVIENADSTFTSLKPGDKLSYIYGDNQIILTLVDSIDINGTTVTVRGAEAHLDDFFDHFQINCESECADVEVVEGTEGDGVTYLGRYGDLQNSTYTLSEDNEVTVSSMMLAGGYSSDPEEYFKTPIAPGSLTFEAEIDKGSFEFTLDLGGDFRIMYDYQIENGKKVDEIWDVRLEVTYDMAVKIGVECKVDEEIKLAEFVLFSFYGINLEVIPKIPYEISGAASVEFRFVGGRVGFQDMYLGEMGGGNHVQCPLNMDPDFAIDVDLEVTIKIGMEFDMAVCFICSDIAKLALSIGAEFVIEASYSGTVFSLAPDELNPPVKHDCGNDCISISAKWGPTVKFTATLFDLNDLSLEYELPIMGEDYYIPVADAYISLKYADAGFGECPHKSYRVDLFLNNSDPENSVVNGASITCEGETKNISSGNHAVFYLHSGMHRFDISVPELESTEEYYVYVDDSPTRCEAFIQYPAKTYTLEFTYPDGSAAAGESVYISNSYAGITDNNGRLDTELCVGKTYSFVTLMSGKGYSDPGKIRIPDINFTGNLQITVYRDGSERPADVQEIEKPWSVIVMVDDVYGEPVSGAELTIDGLGSFTTNKLGVAHIDVPDNNTYYGTAAKTGHLNTRFAIEAGIETVYVRLVKKANDPSDFEYTISNDEVTVTGYKGGSPCAVIPSEIEGCPVTALGSFTCSTVLEELVMPNSVTTIATSGFTSCKDLKKVLFSDSITSIPDYAFENLKELTDIVLPDNLKYIGMEAFCGCTSLKTVDLPEGLTTISRMSFGNCSSLKSVYIPSTITEVDRYWITSVVLGPFSGCMSLKNVVFGTGITTIPEYLFYNCSGLEAIDIPDTVTEIGCDAFHNTAIKELYLPEGLETMNINSFGSCSNLESVYIPSTLKETKKTSYSYLDAGPFNDCQALKEVTFGNGITTIPRLLFYNTGIEKITIPNTVTTIEVKAFCSCDLLYDVTLSNRLEEIGESAFNDCDILGSIDLPAGLTSIGKGAFYSCKALGSIELPADLVTLGENAFGYCTSLVSVNIPASLTTTYTGDGPFWNCSALKNVTFDQGISEIPDRLFYQTGLESIVIPNTVTKIGNYSFYKNTKLVSVTIPASVNEIGRYAFSSTGITELYLPEGLQSLGGSAFENCTSLETVHIPSTLTTLNITSGSYAPFRSCSALKEATFGSGISEIPDELFYNTGLESVVIPDSVKKIGANAFDYCKALESVDLPAGLTSIGKGAFYNCSALESVELPADLVTLGENAFGYCTSLVSVNIPASLTTTYTGNGPFYSCSALKNVTFDQGISEIPDRLFNQTGLESIVIPNTVTKIGNYSFYKNTKLVSVTIPASVNEIGKYAFYYTGIKELYLPEGVQSLGGSAFENCTSLETVHIPSTLTTLNITSGSYAPFRSCSALKEATFGSGISEIPDNLFYDTGLESVVIPNSVKKIGANAFYYCEALGSVDLPTGLTSIGNSAFCNCSALESVELPKGLVTLGENAFGYCKSLVSVNIPASLTTTYTGNGPFWNCSALKNVTFNQGISEIPDRLFYQTGLESVVIPNTVTKIGNYSFYKNTKLVSVTIPASVNEIGKYAFYYTGIKELYLPEGVQSLGGSAFDSCTSLETVHIPSTLTTINITNSYAPFWSCSALKEATFGSGISEIPDKLFYNTGLESVVIPDSVTTIGDYSFSTSTLTAVYIPASVESISTSAFSSCTGLTIYGEMNSYAETFASEKNITFVVGSIPETAAVNSAVVTYEMQSGEELRYTANFTDLDANRIYNFYVMKDRYAQQPFAADNLLYISQHTSDENGVISVTYYPTEVCEDCDIFVVRMRLYDISSANISVADLTYTGERQFADPVVTFDGVELEEGIDYNLKGDFSATEIGTYNMEIVGTGDYYHSTFTSYSILEPEISSIEVTTLPETTEYMLNEELDITGAELTVTYVNNTAKKLSITADMVTGFDSTSVGDKTLTVTYGGQTATFVITVKAVGEFDHALDYTDNIGLVFYMKLGEDILSDDSAEMVFSLNGKTVKVPVAEAAPATVNDDTVYAFTCPVSAAEMADDIQAQIVTNDYESDTFTYSILQYVSDRYTDFRDGEHESGELAEYNAIAAMLNYGAAAQEYFGHNTETLANSCLDPSDRNVSSIDAGTLSSNRYLITDIKHTKIFRGLVIALKDQVSIKLYFSKNGLSLDDFTVTTGGESIDPSRLSVTCDESDTILEISDIGAGDLGESFTVTIGDVTISNISVLSYAQQVLSTDIEELSDIATALVNYNNCVITAKQCENAA